MDQPQSFAWQVRRGVLGCLLAGLASGFAATAFMIALDFWHVYSSYPTPIGEILGRIFSRSYGERLYEILCQQAFPVALLGACVGLANWLPAGKYRFVRTFILIGIATTVLWAVTFATYNMYEVHPPRFKGMKHPVYYPSELFAVLLPPIVVTLVCVLVRHEHERINLNSGMNCEKSNPSPNLDQR